jgi:hypothetical protein
MKAGKRKSALIGSKVFVFEFGFSEWLNANG